MSIIFGIYIFKIIIKSQIVFAPNKKFYYLLIYIFNFHLKEPVRYYVVVMVTTWMESVSVIPDGKEENVA